MLNILKNLCVGKPVLNFKQLWNFSFCRCEYLSGYAWGYTDLFTWQFYKMATMIDAHDGEFHDGSWLMHIVTFYNKRNSTTTLFKY